LRSEFSAVFSSQSRTAPILAEALRPSVDLRAQRPRHFCYSFLRLLCCAFFAAAASVYALDPRTPLWEFGHQSWQSDSGLPQNTVGAIVQTRDGYLWIGTEEGLVRYDGIDFQVFDPGNTPALHSSLISALAADPTEGLWISTPAGLVYERAGRFTRYGIAEGLASLTVLGVHVTPAGQLFALTSAGVARLRDGHFERIPATEGLMLTEGANLFAENTHGRMAIAGPLSVLALDGNSTAGANPIAVP
jgi:ligand-binding sensor domain-containing protein